MERQVVLALSLLCFFDAAVLGQSYMLGLGSVQGTFDSELEIPLTLSTDVELRGVQAVFDWDPSSGTGMALNVWGEELSRVRRECFEIEGLSTGSGVLHDGSRNALPPFLVR